MTWKRVAKKAYHGVSNAILQMRPPSGRPIAIVGNGRSGTSWIGSTFGQAPDVIYYREPCNPRRTGITDDTVWSRCVPPHGQDAYFERYLSAAFAGSSPQYTISARQLIHYATTPYRIVVKEVATFPSVEWMHARWNPEILIVVRHPCGCARSVYKAGIYVHEAERLARIAHDDYIREQLGDLAEHAMTASTPLEISSAIWAIKNYVVLKAMERHPDWHVVRYEDVCADPVDTFRTLFHTYGLNWSDGMEHWIESTTQHDVPGAYSTSRITAHRVGAWRRTLSKAEIHQVRHMVEPFDLPFYDGEDDW